MSRGICGNRQFVAMVRAPPRANPADPTTACAPSTELPNRWTMPILVVDTEGHAMPHREPGPINLNRYEIEPSYSGIQTFLKLPLCLTPEDLRAGHVDVAIGGAPWDGTITTRSGTHLGPQ